MTPWQLDQSHSTIRFSVRHMMVSTVRGGFGAFTMDVEFDPDHPELGAVSAVVQSASIDTGDTDRDGHLRSPEFLDAVGFPVMTFTSTSVVPRSGGTYVLTGDLAIRGQTHPVTFDAEYFGEVANAQGGRSAGFTIEGRLSRKAWGLTWNLGLEAGGLAVSDEVKVLIDVELVRVAAVEVHAPEPELAGVA